MNAYTALNESDESLDHHMIGCLPASMIVRDGEDDTDALVDAEDTKPVWENEDLLSECSTWGSFSVSKPDRRSLPAMV